MKEEEHPQRLTMDPRSCISSCYKGYHAEAPSYTSSFLFTCVRRLQSCLRINSTVSSGIPPERGLEPQLYHPSSLQTLLHEYHAWQGNDPCPNLANLYTAYMSLVFSVGVEPTTSSSAGPYVAPLLQVSIHLARRLVGFKPIHTRKCSTN